MMMLMTGTSRKINHQKKVFFLEFSKMFNSSMNDAGELKEILHDTRLRILEDDLAAVQRGTSESYLAPLRDLENTKKKRLMIAKRRK